jgi:uroporphyrinogen decarboxylase
MFPPVSVNLRVSMTPPASSKTHPPDAQWATKARGVVEAAILFWAMTPDRCTLQSRMRDLTPRERVLLALSRQETDRVPVDFLATPEAWAGLKGALGTDDTEEILRRLGCDLRHPRQPYIGPARRTHRDGSWSDEWGVRRRQVAHIGGAYDEIVGHPLAELNSIRELDNYPWPQACWWDAAALNELIREMDRGEACALALEEFGDPGGIFETGCYLRGMEPLLVDLVERPDLAYVLFERITRCLLARLENVMRAVGPRIDFIWTSDDIAHQHGPLLSPRSWKELIAPHHERFNRRVHELGSRVMYHSCGAVRPFIPELIETGIDVLDVLQFSADGMDPAEIKSSFGDRLCFHGGVDVQGLLPFGTPENVRDTVHKLIETLGHGGGFILCPSHNIQVDAPVPNILAVYEAAGSLQLL